MPVSIGHSLRVDPTVRELRGPLVVLGVTSAQTCLVLKGRVRALRDAGFRVTLISSPGALLDELARDEGADRIELRMRRAIAPLSDLRALVQLWRTLRKLQPDIVEFSTPKAGLLGMLAARFARVPRRVYLLRGLKLETAGGLKRVLLASAEWFAMACADVVLCNSASLMAKAVTYRLAPQRKLCVLGAGSGIGVDCDHFAQARAVSRAELGIPECSVVIGFTGRLTRDKGVLLLFEAFERIHQSHPEVYLLLVGWWDKAEDAVEAEFREEILSHPNVRCSGFTRDVASYLRAMDIFALPTYREGFPNAILEASAAALPVVTTDATGARDAIVPDVTGLMVPAGSAEALLGALLKLLQDSRLREEMGQEGRQWVRENFERRHVLSLNSQFYRDLLVGIWSAISRAALRQTEALQRLATD